MNELREKFMNKDGVEHNLWIIPSSFIAMRYISDARCLPKDTTLKDERLIKPKKKTVHLLHGRSTTSPKDFSSFKDFSTHAIHNFALGEELPVHHGNKYKFHV